MGDLTSNRPVEKVLDAADYRVRVRRDGDGVVITVPPNLLASGRTTPVVQRIRARRGDFPGVECLTNDEDPVFVATSEFAFRTIMNGFVRRACESVMFPKRLVEYTLEDGSEVAGVVDMIEAPEESGMEDVLASFVEAGVIGGFGAGLDIAARSLGLGDEFEICKVLYTETKRDDPE